MEGGELQSALSFRKLFRPCTEAACIYSSPAYIPSHPLVHLECQGVKIYRLAAIFNNVM